MESLIIYNLLVLLGGALFTAGLVYLWRRDPERRRRLFATRAVRLSFWVLAVYFSVGYLDFFRLPPSVLANSIDSVSPLDVLFAPVTRERSYSAPFAEQVLLAADLLSLPYGGDFGSELLWIAEEAARAPRSLRCAAAASTATPGLA